MCRYLLSFTGKDEIGEARFFAYDDETQRIVQKDCEAIVNPLEARDGLPQALQNIINKKYIFSVDLTNDSCRSNKKRQYQIKAVLERPPRRAFAQTTSMPETQIVAVDDDPKNLTDPKSSGAAMLSPQHQSTVVQVKAGTQSVSTSSEPLFIYS